MQTDLEIQRERADTFARQQEANETEVQMTARNHSDRLRQMKEQFSKERAAVKKQQQAQLAEVKRDKNRVWCPVLCLDDQNHSLCALPAIAYC